MPGRFAELMRGPELPGVVRNDEHGTSAGFRKRRASDLKRARLAGRNACSLWKQRDPDALIEARLAFLDQRSQRTARVVAIDCDRTQQTKCPAEERDVEQLALYQRCLRREQRLDEQRFPRALMFHEDDAGFTSECSRDQFTRTRTPQQTRSQNNTIRVQQPITKWKRKRNGKIHATNTDREPQKIVATT